MSAIAGATLTLNLSQYLEKKDAEIRKLRDKADEITAKVIAEDREFTKDEEQSLRECQEGVASLTKTRDAVKRQAESNRGLDEPRQPRTRPPTGSQADPTIIDPDEDDDEVDAVAKREKKRKERKYRTAFTQWLRGGMERLTSEQRSLLQENYATLPDSPEARDLSALTGAAGGFTVPEGFIAEVERAMKDFSGVMKSRAQQIPTTSGNDLPWPTVNDTSNKGEQVGENTATTTDTAMASAFGQVVLKGYLYSSKLILVPIQLLQDSGITIDGLLSDLLAERLGRIINDKFTFGTGANEPLGIVTGSTLGKQVASSSAITYSELVDLEHSVDPAYRANAEFMMHDSTIAVFKKLLDSQGRPIWQPAMTASMANGAPGTILNHPYIYNQSMDTVASGKKSVLFGDMSKYKVRKIRNLVMVRLTERYAEKFQVGFFGFMRADGRSVDVGSAIKHILHP